MKTYKYFSVIVILVLLIVATPAQAATMLTVDASTGTIDFGNACPNPTSNAVYKSLQAAIDCAVDGDTIEVINGTYGVTGQTNQDGYSTAILIKDLDDLTIQSAPGHNPVVKPATPADIVSISIEGSERLTIDNIDSDQTVAQFDNWHVFDADGLTVRNSHFEGGEDGIDFNTDLTTALIENNSFVDVNTGSGDEVLDFTDASYVDVTIQDNLFQNNYRHITINPPSGKSASDFIIRRNIMDGTTSEEAIRLIGASDILVENNVIMNNMQQGVYIDNGSSNITVRHNTFFNNDQEDESNGELRTNVTTSDIVIKNNVFYGNGSNPVFETTVSGLPGEDYNLVYNFSGSFTFGTNTITGDPLFMNTTAGSEDLHLQFGSPAIEEGVDLGVTDDIEKNARPNPTGTAPDIGAYEAGSSDDEGPVTTETTADPNPVAVGSSVLVTANVDDTTTGGSNIASANYEIYDDGDVLIGSGSMLPADVFDSPTEDVTASITAPTTAGIYDLCVYGTDAVGNTGESECIMFVVYDPSGGFVTGGGWIDSPAGAAAPVPSLVWNQGFETNTDGWLDSTNGWYGTMTRVPSGTNGLAASGGAYYATFEDDGDSAPFTGFDGYRSVWPGTWIAEIDVYLDTTWPNGQGFDYAVAATGSDGVHQRDYIFHVGVVENYGSVVGKALLVNGSNNTDFYANPYKLVNDNGSNFYEVTTTGWYTLQHVFYDAGGYLAVDLNLIDANGNVLWTATRSNVADTIPAEVGGNRYGWFTFISVDGGIAVDEHQLTVPIGPTGKATFGFVSKYKKGASVPDGNTEFQFKAGDLNFKSTSYEWLVVTGSNYAKFKGAGTINGEGDYKFQLWAGDGTGSNGEDTFRIKIWYEENGSEVVVYDNGMDQAIGGGSIVVHKAK